MSKRTGMERLRDAATGGYAVSLDNEEAVEVASQAKAMSDAWDTLRDAVLHNEDGFDSDVVNIYLGLIDDTDPRPTKAPGDDGEVCATCGGSQTIPWIPKTDGSPAAEKIANSGLVQACPTCRPLEDNPTVRGAYGLWTHVCPSRGPITITGNECGHCHAVPASDESSGQ